MSRIKTRKPSKLYTFQNTQPNHLLGVGPIDWLQYCTIIPFLLEKETRPHWKQSSTEPGFQRITLVFMYYESDCYQPQAELPEKGGR